MKLETNCDAVMIGRGVLGNPWLIKQCIDFLATGTYEKNITLNDKIDMLKKHLTYLKKDKNEKTALLEIRSHALWYLKGEKNSAKIKNMICSAKSSKEVFDILGGFVKDEDDII